MYCYKIIEINVGRYSGSLPKFSEIWSDGRDGTEMCIRGLHYIRIKPGRGQLGYFLLGPHRLRTSDEGEN